MMTSNLPGQTGARRGDCPFTRSFDLLLPRMLSELGLPFLGSRSELSLRLSFFFGCSKESIEKEGRRAGVDVLCTCST